MPRVAEDPGEAVHLLIAFHTMISGYVTMAPLHEALREGIRLDREEMEARAAGEA